MRKVILGIALMATALFVRAQNGGEFRLIASDMSPEIEGRYARICDFQNEEVLDSVLIKNGGFVYVHPADETKVLWLYLSDYYMMLFNLERGTFAMKYDDNGVLVREGNPTSSFMLMQEFDRDMEQHRSITNANARQRMGSLASKGATLGEQAEEIERIMRDSGDEKKSIYRKYLTKGGNTLLDFIAIVELSGELSEREYIEYFEAAGPIIRENKELRQYYDYCLKQVVMNPSGSFIDYEMVNKAGVKKRLSEFREEGKYFLLDYFASWCAPCGKSMPIIAEIEKEFGTQLTTASIAIWEEGDSDRLYEIALERFGITWHSFHDSACVGVNTYQLRGVPTFILFSPDGVMIMKSNNIQEVRVKLQGLLR